MEAVAAVGNENIRSFKVILFGDGCSGTSDLITRYVFDCLSDENHPTHSGAFGEKVVRAGSR